MAEYIEREKAIEEFTFADADVCQEYADYECEFGFSREAIKQVLGQMPAADVAPVRHGRWIKHEGYDECELCHAKTIYGGNYCPECGARMGKEDEHEAG